ncbi:MAG: aminotransferase class I/II-fold pyridoxal phosphate-dependent enzyme [Alphaproteobacteria bacterium]|nr:aminotransferase class I/II-fold pyridoxal phosphate-dependent enzyme [Alphaproteobacteria bacterium]
MALKAARRSAIAPFLVMDVLRAASARDRAAHDADGRCVHLEIGQPGQGAPRPVLDAAAKALYAETLGYTETFGVPTLRARIARHYAETYGIEVPIERIVVTTGSSGAFILSFLAAFDAGDRVALADPGYPAYRNILAALGIEVVGLPADAATRFQPTVELLERAGRLDGLIVASPANPTGTMLASAELRRLAGWCDAHGVRFVSDEIYHGIVFGEPATTALAHSTSAIVINSFSKYYAMTGWRLGWMILPEDLLRPVEVLAQNLFISPPTLPQLAGLAAFDCRAELDARVAAYRANRDLLMAELPKAGFRDFAPADGAFYLYCDVGHMTNDSQQFCRRLLDEAGVAATPGVDFDRDRGSRFLRFSFAGSNADIREAVRRLKAWRGVG